MSIRQMTAFEDKRKAPFIWLELEVDDLPLSPATIRLYVHIVRRAGASNQCFAAIDTMAKHIRVSPGTAKRAIKTLLDCQLIKRHSRKGQTSIYSVTQKSEWNIDWLASEPGSSETQVVGELGLQRSTRGSSATQEVDHQRPTKKDLLKKDLLKEERKKEIPPLPPNGGDGEQEDFENVEEESQESSPEPLPVKDEPPTKAIATGRGKSSAAKSSRKKKQLPSKSQYHAEECDRLWAVWNPLFQEMRGTRDSLKGFVSGYDWLIETGVSPDDIEEGLTYYVENKWGQFRDSSKSPIMPPDGVRFFKGSRDHPDSYCLDALEMKRERASGRVVSNVTSDEQIQAQKSEIGRELRRLNLPGVLSPDWTAHFGVQFVGELNYEQGAEFLRSLKETPDREVSRV